MTTPSSPLAALKPLAGRALEIALNRLLALDGDAREDIAKLEGKRIALALEAPALALEIKVVDGALRVGPVSSEGEPDLSLRSSIGGLLSQLPLLKKDNSAPVGKLRINGDVDLARRVQQLAERFDPDWDVPFVQVFGALLGPQMAKGVREGLRAGMKIAGNVARDAAEFVTEESRDVVAKAELAAFHEDVDQARDRAERLLARFERLRAKAGVTL